jgi:hypothetical protein
MPFTQAVRFAGIVVLAVLSATPHTKGAQQVRQIGSFHWDTTGGDVLLQQPSSDRLLVQVRVLTGSQTSAGSWKSRPLPTAAMEAWVLLEDGSALEQTPRQPPKGAPAIGIGSAGGEYSFVNVGFKARPENKIAAVVVRIESDFHVFAVHDSKN